MKLPHPSSPSQGRQAAGMQQIADAPSDLRVALLLFISMQQPASFTHYAQPNEHHDTSTLQPENPMKPTVTFLGPMGTYSHLVAAKRFRGAELLPQSGILDACAYLTDHPHARGIIPIENSSGGTINETIDILLDDSQPIAILEEIALHVELALLGHANIPIQRLYSHFVPLEHCAPWIREHLPHVEKHECGSTAAAAERAAHDPQGAALCGRQLAARFGLDRLEFPVASSTPNITTFIVVAATPAPMPRQTKTTISLRLPNVAGSLYRFLGTLQQEGINLSRLVSRPIRGKRQEYAFLVDLDAAAHSPPVQRALAAAREEAVSLRICGSFPAHRVYRS